MFRFQLSFYAVFFLQLLLACNYPQPEKDTGSSVAEVSDTLAVRLELVTTSVETPVEYQVAPKGGHRAFITDVNGKIWTLEKDSLVPQPFFDIYSRMGEEEIKSGIGAISGVAFHPDFAANGKFYVCYNKSSNIKNNFCKLVVSEFTNAEKGQSCADLSTERKVLEIEGKNICANGSQIAFGPDEFLYISIGDDAIGDSNYIYKAQNLKFLNGKILRIDVNVSPYAIPANNPFVAVKDARPEIWAYGFRKVWGFTFEPGTNDLYGADVGEMKVEEVDLISKGGNYGWPVSEGDSVFRSNGGSHAQFISPIHQYPRAVGICIIGGEFYKGNEVPLLKGKYVFGDFNGTLFALTKNNKGKWQRQVIKVVNKGEELFLVCGFGLDENNELIVMGLLNTKTGQKGAIYKIARA